MPTAAQIAISPDFDIAPLLQLAIDLDNDEHVEPITSPKRRASTLDSPSAQSAQRAVLYPNAIHGSLEGSVVVMRVSDAAQRRQRPSDRTPAPTTTATQGIGSAPSNKDQRQPFPPAFPPAPVDDSVDASAKTGNLDTKRNKNRKRKKRRVEREQDVVNGVGVPPQVVLTHVQASTALETPLDLANLPATSCGYQARVADSSKRVAYCLEDLLKEGYRLEEWDGRSTKVLVDPKTHKIFAVAVGRPDDAAYDAAYEEAYAAMLKAGQEGAFTEEELSHRRGEFPAVNVGISYGHGAQAPHNLRTHHHTAMLQDLLHNPGVTRMANFASSAFQTWAPDVYEYYRRRLESLYQQMPHLQRNFSRSVFACAAFNLGPQVTTYPHRDCQNCPFGLCAIQSFGRFNPKKGGHLVLPQLKLILEFPPGSLVLIPSATLTHANIPVQPGETRLSFTQFTAGSIFRFVDNGFRTEKQYEEEDEAGYKRMKERKKGRWAYGIGLWSTVNELVARAEYSLL